MLLAGLQIRFYTQNHNDGDEHYLRLTIFLLCFLIARCTYFKENLIPHKMMVNIHHLKN